MLLPIRLARHLCVAVWRGAREIALGLRRAAGRFANQVTGVVRHRRPGRDRTLPDAAIERGGVGHRSPPSGWHQSRARRRVACQTLDRTPSQAPVHAWPAPDAPCRASRLGARDARYRHRADRDRRTSSQPDVVADSPGAPPVRRSLAGRARDCPRPSMGSRAIREPGDWCRSIGRADRDRTLPDAAIARGVVGRRSPPSGRHQSRARSRVAGQTLDRTQSRAPVHARIDRHPLGHRTTIGTVADTSQADGPDDTGVEGFAPSLARTGASRCIDGPTVRRGRCASCFSTGSSRRLARPEPGPDRAWCARLGGEAGQNQHRP